MKVTARPVVAQPGRPIVYHVQVRNAGPGDAVLPVLTVTLPTGVTIAGVDVATCRPGRVVTEVICPSPKDVLAGGSGGVTISGVVRPAARGPLRAVATLTSEVEDANEADNTATNLTDVDGGADLGLSLKSRTRSGGVTLSALVRNRGPRLVRDAQVFLRAGRAHLLSSMGGRCRSRHGYISCRLRPVPSGGRQRLRLTLSAARRTMTARASVFSTEYGDRRPADNRARTR